MADVGESGRGTAPVVTDVPGRNSPSAVDMNGLRWL
eukprot:CAMPEP_0182906408 /NCGR_PEP_ID=MMETSP0034_2-20130328/33712_1 /TAXON_ID=156128 /ORGANISM="Nephroselmis pyriformis, Strain CCMP717" /LENGTH=35 /DNA_ID= /DNA_START= /DNA_END= /DNA_ORIENTATION=